MWNVKMRVVPIMNSASGAKHRLKEWLALFGVHGKRYNTIQQTALLRSAQFLKKCFLFQSIGNLERVYITGFVAHQPIVVKLIIIKCVLYYKQ